MLHKISSRDIYKSEHDWLASKFLFSFAEYHDSENMSWGKIRVWNDDTIAPENGFPMHSHENFEIITLMFDGELTHIDNLGNEAVLRRGYIQHMSAGTGITHSEWNHGISPVELYQIWIAPKKRNIKPLYQEREIGFNQHGLHELISNEAHFESAPHLALPINADAKVYYGYLKDGDHIVHALKSDDYALIYVRSGHVVVSHHDLKAGDELRVHGEENLAIHARENTEFVMVVTW